LNPRSAVPFNPVIVLSIGFAPKRVRVGSRDEGQKDRDEVQCRAERYIDFPDGDARSAWCLVQAIYVILNAAAPTNTDAAIA
jgi:hypothetical protein